MGKETLDQNFWNQKWEENKTGWDIGKTSPPIEKYFQKIEDKNVEILIPGCGNAYEAEFLQKNGFKNITVLDIAPKATEILREKFKNIPEIKVLCKDFFQHQGKYDFIVEQTFFCAIPVSERERYAEKTAELLKKEGRIVGVLFNNFFEFDGPPFGGNTEEYREIFSKYFEIEKLEICNNSIKPRLGNEVFINFKRK